MAIVPEKSHADAQIIPIALWTQKTNVLFIVGAPRSGTTWLQALLASHPEVATGPETHFFKAFASAEAIYRQSLPRPVGIRQYLPNGEFYNLCAEIFYRITSQISRPQGDIRYFLEKTPEHSLHAEFILKCFPQARFIHIIRDARHVVASLIRTSKAYRRGASYIDATTAAKVWNDFVTAAGNIASQVQHPEQYIEVKYESLRRNPHHELGKLFKTLDLSADPQDIASIIDSNSLETVKRQSRFLTIAAPSLSHNPIPEPSGFFGSGAYGSGFGLSPLQRLQVERLTGDMLVQHGYCDSKPRIPLWAIIACSWKLRTLLRIPTV